LTVALGEIVPAVVHLACLWIFSLPSKHVP
jgi:hypothetical protein